jgi:hypothetical protein
MLEPKQLHFLSLPKISILYADIYYVVHTGNREGGKEWEREVVMVA